MLPRGSVTARKPLIFKEVTVFRIPVNWIGYNESTIRKEKMLARGDNAEVPVLNKDNELILSPIAHFTEDDIFTYIGERASNLFEGYTDFEDTKRIYAHSAGTSCVVVAQAIYDDKPKSGGCGARHGCFLCQKAEDKSLEAMIAFDSRYEYARGLNRLNKFIRNIRYDWSLRHWVGRTIKGGYVAKLSGRVYLLIGHVRRKNNNLHYISVLVDQT